MKYLKLFLIAGIIFITTSAASAKQYTYYMCGYETYTPEMKVFDYCQTISYGDTRNMKECTQKWFPRIEQLYNAGKCKEVTYNTDNCQKRNNKRLNFISRRKCEIREGNKARAAIIEKYKKELEEQNKIIHKEIYDK